MKGDPEYRRLLDKHGFDIGMVQTEGLIQAQMQTKKHHLLQAIAEIEIMERKKQRGVKEHQLNQMMRKFMFEQVQVAKVYNPPRIAAMARRKGMRAGWSLDLTTCDEYGRPWDFNNKSMRNARVRKLI